MKLWAAVFAWMAGFSLQGCSGKTVVVGNGTEEKGCPRASLGEAAEDCPWAELARELGAEIEAGRAVGTLFEQKIPELLRQIREDSKIPEVFGLWGTSINYDEYAKGEIVRPELMDFVLKAAGVGPRQGRNVHAGLEHTYGYLFSLLRTSYGYKRARWVKDDIERGFGLSRGALGPQPSAGTLLQNLTVLSGRIALESDRAASKLLTKLEKQVHPDIRAFVSHSLSSRPRRRLEETVKVGARELLLRTDFVSFQEAGSNAALLVYSVHEKGRGVLITAFPVAQSFMENAFKPEGLGEGKPVVTRYNAFVDGLTGVQPPFAGKRSEVAVRKARCRRSRC
jgi:hypothetical protein